MGRGEKVGWGLWPVTPFPRKPRNTTTAHTLSGFTGRIRGSSASQGRLLRVVTEKWLHNSMTVNNADFIPGGVKKKQKCEPSLGDCTARHAASGHLEAYLWETGRYNQARLCKYQLSDNNILLSDETTDFRHSTADVDARAGQPCSKYTCCIQCCGGLKVRKYNHQKSDCHRTNYVNNLLAYE